MRDAVNLMTCDEITTLFVKGSFDDLVSTTTQDSKHPFEKRCLKIIQT